MNRSIHGVVAAVEHALAAARDAERERGVFHLMGYPDRQDLDVGDRRRTLGRELLEA